VVDAITLMPTNSPTGTPEVSGLRARYTQATAWTASRLTDGTKCRLLELFVLGVPVYRQRFRALASAPAIERFYRLVRACALMSRNCGSLRRTIECDETTIGGLGTANELGCRRQSHRIGDPAAQRPGEGVSWFPHEKGRK